jgi:hypothetical protein
MKVDFPSLLGSDMESPQLLAFLKSMPVECDFDQTHHFDSMASKENGLEISFNKQEAKGVSHLILIY